MILLFCMASVEIPCGIQLAHKLGLMDTRRLHLHAGTLEGMARQLGLAVDQHTYM